MKKILICLLCIALFDCGGQPSKPNPTQANPTQLNNGTVKTDTGPLPSNAVTTADGVVLLPTPSVDTPIIPAETEALNADESLESTTLAPEIVRPSPEDFPLLTAADWADIASIHDDDLISAWPAWLKSCDALAKQSKWQQVCEKAQLLANPTQSDIVDYFTSYFDLFRAHQSDGGDHGTVTGYYQPLLQGSLTQSDTYPYPLYRAPTNLFKVDLDSPTKRARLEGNILVPYFTRAEIDASPSPLAGLELVWIDNLIDVFFLQVQGSGIVSLDNGEQLHVGFADHNGHAYQSIGRVLIQRGEMKASEASMQRIKQWAANHPEQVQDLLNENPRYIFFKTLEENLPGPIGALGVPITAERSIAVDKQFIPLGAPVFLSTSYPNSDIPLNRLVMAQDTGSAIKGGVRADYYWGTGQQAGEVAGRMTQQGSMWVMLPKEF